MQFLNSDLIFIILDDILRGST